MKLGIVLATDDLGNAAALAHAARRGRHEVAMFVMDRGIAALAREPAVIAALVDDDCELIACSNSAAGTELPADILRGSQDDHAAILATSDRVIALT